MAKTQNSKDRISISLSPAEKTLLAQIARKNQISIARVVRQAITDFLHSTDRQLFLFKEQSGTFDLAYARLVLMHLVNPGQALEAMRRLVRPGGCVACEEMDLTRWICDPPSNLVRRFYELNITLGERHGGHFRLGPSLPGLFQAAGLAPEVAANFPLAIRGEQKRLLELTFREFASELVREQLASQAEVDAIAAELVRVSADETTLLAFPLLVQAWARRD